MPRTIFSDPVAIWKPISKETTRAVGWPDVEEARAKGRKPKTKVRRTKKRKSYAKTAHGLLFINCPHCNEKIPGRAGAAGECKRCERSFQITPTGTLPGFKAECSNCGTGFYSEKIGRLKCPNCKEQSWHTAKGEVC